MTYYKEYHPDYKEEIKKFKKERRRKTIEKYKGLNE